MTPLEAVRAKVIEAVPNAASCNVSGCNGHHLSITLADVLRAIEKYRTVEQVFTVYPNGIMAWEQQDDIGYPQEQASQRWNLALSLDEQEPDVIEFLAKILL